MLLPVSASQQETMDEVVTKYQNALTQDEGAVRYLMRRGLDKGIVTGSRLGVVSNPEQDHSHVNGWLCIPYLDKNDVPLSMRFRCIQEHDCSERGHGKYMGLTDEPTRTFNVQAIVRAKNEINLTEGEMDCITLHKMGLHAIGIPGVHNWKPWHRRMLAGFGVINIWADTDTEGLKFARKVQGQLRHARVVPLPAKDVNASFVQYGAEHLLSLIRERG